MQGRGHISSHLVEIMIQEGGPGMASSSPSSTPSKRKFVFAESPAKKNHKSKDEIRKIELGQYKERHKKGCYMTVDLGGTDHPIIKADNWLQQHDLKLSDLEKYYEIAWNPGLGVHVCKTISQKHFIDISNALITHCTGALSRSHNHSWHMVANISLFADLTFMIDVSNGLWFDRFVSVFLNTSANKLAFTSKCVTAFLHVLQSATGEMELQQRAQSGQGTRMCMSWTSVMKTMLKMF